MGDAVKRLAREMASTRERYLPLGQAKQLVDGAPTSLSRSLLAVLENESLISVVESAPRASGEDPVYAVRFTFERVGDFLVAENLLDQVADLGIAFADGGPLAFLSEGNNAATGNGGLLEALSILFPETHGTELIDAHSGIDSALLWGPFLRGLQWRTPAHVAFRTRELVTEALCEKATAKLALEAVLGLTPRPGNLLNAEYLHEFLAPIPLLTRDPVWANMLEGCRIDSPI